MPIFLTEFMMTFMIFFGKPDETWIKPADIIPAVSKARSETGPYPGWIRKNQLAGNLSLALSYKKMMNQWNNRNIITMWGPQDS